MDFHYFTFVHLIYNSKRVPFPPLHQASILHQNSQPLASALNNVFFPPFFNSSLTEVIVVVVVVLIDCFQLETTRAHTQRFAGCGLRAQLDWNFREWTKTADDPPFVENRYMYAVDYCSIEAVHAVAIDRPQHQPCVSVCRPCESAHVGRANVAAVHVQLLVHADSTADGSADSDKDAATVAGAGSVEGGALR